MWVWLTKLVFTAATIVSGVGETACDHLGESVLCRATRPEAPRQVITAGQSLEGVETELILIQTAGDSE